MANYKLDWFGTARGRVGFLPTDRVLLHATGGLAYRQLSATAPLIPLSWGSTRAGWTVGAGAEVALDHNWSFKVEYLHRISAISAVRRQRRPRSRTH
jgi:outer membrane immunogenic protein